MPARLPVSPLLLALTRASRPPFPLPPAGAAGWLKSTLAAPVVQAKYSGVLNGIGAWPEAQLSAAALHAETPLPASACD